MISNSNFKSVKQKFVDFVTSDEIMSIVFNLVYGFNETKEIKFFDGDSRDNVLTIVAILTNIIVYFTRSGL